MLDLKDIGLIEPDDELPPRHCLLTIVRNEGRIEAPIPQPTGTQIALLTLFLAAVSTPFCIAIYRGMQRSDHAFGVGVMIVACWTLSVFGPAAFWMFIPVGWLRPDHWIRFDRESGILSIRGGYSEFHRDEIIALLSVTDLRKKKRQTEFQIVTVCSTSASTSKHFVANCGELNANVAFATVIREIGSFAGIPCWFAIIDPDGKTSIDRFETATESEAPS